jgi:hypothetical protein
MPPGAKPTISLIGFAGQGASFCANAGFAGSIAAVAAAAPAIRKWRRRESKVDCDI